MSEPFLSEIRIFSFNFAPKGWALCNGQLLPINQNQALFSLLGTTFGGDGRVNFALPNLQGRIPFHVGNGLTLGERAGEENHTLSIPELPFHSHFITASSNTPNVDDPTNAFWATNTGRTVYSSNINTQLSPTTTPTSVGGSQPHTNMPPYLVLNFSIALQGIFPSSN